MIMSDIIKAACVQMNAKPDIDPNIKAAEILIREAAGQGAQFISTPENTDIMGASQQDTLAAAQTEDTHPGLPRFSNLAKELNAWLLIGSMKIKLSDNKMANRAFLFNPDGQIAARYDKIHLYDVDLPTGESHRESHEIEPGTKVVLVQTPLVNIGMTICYDLRFPHLYRDLAKKGAQILTIPAAFTVPTGTAHWSVLQRARAIETGCFVVSAAQSGGHAGGRKTYGHSIIVAPWGEVLAEAGTEDETIITADIDLSLVDKARAAIPALQHDRDYAF